MVAEGEPVDPLGIWLRKISSNTPPMKEAISCYNKDDVFVGREYHNTHELNETIPGNCKYHLYKLAITFQPKLRNLRVEPHVQLQPHNMQRKLLKRTVTF